jgi:DNA-binding MarR family transcriptional regulator
LSRSPTGHSPAGQDPAGRNLTEQDLTTQDPPAFRVFNEIGILEHLSRTMFERVMPEGMTVAQFGILNHFVRLGGERSPARLAAAFQVTKPTMTSTLQRLERAGLVAIRPDPRDGRAKVVAITERGVAMRWACIEALEPVLAQLGALVPAGDFEALLPGLTRLRQTLDAERERFGTPRADAP